MPWRRVRWHDAGQSVTIAPFIPRAINGVAMPLDTIRSLGARMFLNKYFEDVGEVVEASFEPRENKASLLVALHGEAEQVWLELDYRLEREHFVLAHFRCERKWMENLLNRYVAGLRLEVDNSFAQSVLGFLL